MAESPALQIQVPDAMKTIGSMLNFATGAQNLQKGNVELQQNQIKLQERQGIQQLFANPQQFIGPDGQPDFNKLINEGMKVAPTTFPSMVPQIIQSHRDGMAAKKAALELDNTVLETTARFVGSLAQDKPDVAFGKMDELVKLRPQLGPAAALARKNFLDPAAQSGDPERWRQATNQFAQSIQTLAEQRAAATPTPYTVQTGQTTQAVNVNPQAAPVGQVIPGTQAQMQVSPGNLETLEKGPDGNSYIVSRTPSGAIVSTRPLSAAGGTAPGQGTPPPRMPYFPPGAAGDVDILTKDRAFASDAAAQVPTQRFNNKQVIDILSNPTPGYLSQTGAGAQALARFGSAVGVPVGDDYATNIQKIGHYLALQTQANAKAMGAGTDAAREVSALTTGNTAMTPTALLSIAKVNDALSLGVQRYQQGMEAAIRNSGGNVLAARDYKTEWAKNFDPDLMRLLIARENGDSKEAAEIVKNLGGPESKRFQELRRKGVILNNLITNGRP